MSSRYFKLSIVGFLLCAMFALAGIVAHTFISRENPARVLEICASAGNKPLCYATEIENLLRAKGISAAFDALALAYDTDPGFAGTCHDVTHELGKAAYEEFQKTGKTELTSKASYCGYGFYHGFMDALYVDTNDMEVARAFCTYVGKNVPHPPPPEFAEGSCYHGIGHGITDGTDPRLWGDAVAIAKPGLAVCDKVSAGNETWHMRCVSGVFNAIGNMYPNPKYKLDSGTDPYALCRVGGFTPLETETCYDQMNTQAAALANHDLKGMVAFGNTITNQKYRALAIHEAVSFYIQILKWDQKQLQPEQVRVCELPTAELRDSCVSGLVGGIFEFGSPGKQYIEAENLCSAETFPAGLRDSCYATIQLLSEYYFEPDVLHTVCGQIPEKYRKSQCDV
ncbi:hypothetical protein K8R03_02830 [Candidatus Kaiserbacteria bacterium]|nr:hypothetical protein [Candidatus Kaiserbacteria bacterium]